MKFLEKKLIFATQEKFYQIQISQKKKIDSESYQLVLKPVDKNFLRNFSFKKILLGYPYVNIFLPLVPTPHKKEFQNLAEFFLPKEVFSNNLPQYIQIFPVNDTHARYVQYQLTKQGKNFIKKLPFQCRWEFMFSFFSRKLFLNATQLDKNLALFFENEIILVQKYFSDLHYLSNFRNLTQDKFLESVKYILPFQANENYYFKPLDEGVELASYEANQAEILSQISFSSRMLSFFWSDFFYCRPALIKKATAKSKKIRILKFLPKIAVVFIVIAVGYFSYNFYDLNQLKKELKEIRNYTTTTQNEVTTQLAAKGKKVLQSQVLTQLINEQSISPQIVFENLDNWLGKNSWLVFLELISLKGGQKEIKMQLASTKPNFSEQKQTDLSLLFKNKKITIQKKGEQRKSKQKIYFFDVVIN